MKQKIIAEIEAAKKEFDSLEIEIYDDAKENNREAIIEKTLKRATLKGRITAYHEFLNMLVDEEGKWEN